MTRSARGTNRRARRQCLPESGPEAGDPRTGLVWVRDRAGLQTGRTGRTPEQGGSAPHLADLLGLRNRGQAEPRKPRDKISAEARTTHAVVRLLGNPPASAGGLY